MLSPKLAEKFTEIHLPEDDPTSFEAMVRFIHTEELHLTPENLVQIAQIGKKTSKILKNMQILAFLAQKMSF
jgi:hypothetical protein